MSDYNGWDNYETWRVNLDLTSNTGNIYNLFCAFMDGHIAAKVENIKIAERLEQWVLDLYFPIRHIYRYNSNDDYMLAYDIMRRFFLCVNWLEIVENYVFSKEIDNEHP